MAYARWHRKTVEAFVSIVVLLSSIACSMSDLVNGKGLPTDVMDPSTIKTADGAMGAYYSAILAFRTAVAAEHLGVVKISGLLTDELQYVKARSTAVTDAFPYGDGLVDARMDEVQLDGPYDNLHRVRAKTREARGALRKYSAQTSKALIGHLFALEGMAEVMLAELYCSGIPLSTLDFEHDYTLQPGSSAHDVFLHALTLFDSALVVTGDSVNFLNFISIGRARAQLGLHDVVTAASIVRSVPTAYRYLLPIEVGDDSTVVSLFRTINNSWAVSVADREGSVGLPFVSSGDPRSTSDSLIGVGGPWFPQKYRDAGVTSSGINPGKVPVVFASGIEARLIEAEAALLAGDGDWLLRLNDLRTSCIDSVSCPVPAPAGTGGIANLAPLTDPAVDPIPNGVTVRDVRLDLIFKERAYWMFLTGRRQSDLRRLIEQYGRESYTVYPSGLWGRQQLSSYGSRISLPVPVREQLTNILYRGCEDA